MNHRFCSCLGSAKACCTSCSIGWIAQLRSESEPFQRSRRFPQLEDVRTYNEGQKDMRVLIVDDHPVVVTGCRALFTSDPSVEILEAFNAKEGHRAYLQKHPDVTVVDVRLPQSQAICRSNFQRRSGLQPIPARINRLVSAFHRACSHARMK
ncbi:response regulator transcription factor [Bradyrhizobium sp. YCK136]|uniref:response regulator transcription factor n=2 Tax=Bradyrhizobium TaxID=374 RepID=UPI0035143544